MTGSGDRDDRDEVPASSAEDDLLRAVAAAPERTMPSPRGAGDGDPERFAHFTVLGRLGEGGMGIVYRARDEKLGRIVALKVLPPAFERDETKRQRLLREARVAAAVTHPNLTAIHEIGESEGRIFIAMELVEGRAMRALLGDRPLPVGTVLSLMTQTAAGVAKAHAAGIVHRDLKPENILVSDEGHVKVLDFGLAKRPTDALLVTGTGEGMLLGTPAYMPPEQAHGQPVTAATDVFSLGVVLYELLTAQRPFTGKNLPQLIRSIERDTPAAPSSVNPLVPAAFDAIVAKCLAKEPAERYPDAQALLVDLRKLEASSSRLSLKSTVDHSVVDSLVTPAPSTVPRRVRTWRKGLMLMGALVVAGGAVSALAWSTRTQTTGIPAAAAPTASAVIPSSNVRGIMEWPAPKTSSPEAATLYAEGLQALRDAAISVFVSDMERAIALDPHFAAAHLRLALWEDAGLERGRHIAAATQARASLDARDERLLVFTERLVATTVDVRAAHELAKDLPDDAEALYWAATALHDAGEDRDALDLLSRAIHLDPKFANVEHWRAVIAVEAGDVDAALAAADDCLAVAPNAASCLRRRTEVHDLRGQCQEMEHDARQMIAMEPDDPQGYGYLWTALAGSGAHVQALQELASKQESATRDANRVRSLTLQHAVNLAVWNGDLVSAEASLRTLQRVEANLTDERAHTAEEQLIYVYDEEGDGAKVARVGEDYLRRLPAWTHDGPTRSRAGVLAALRRTGRVSDAQAEAMREAWRQEWRPSIPGRFANILLKTQAAVWLYFYGWVETRSEAREALSELPNYPPLPPNGIASSCSGAQCTPWAKGIEGRCHALAGDADLAIPLLRGAAAWCGDVSADGAPVTNDWIVDAMHDRFLLGQMLEQTSDRDGACAQYASILARWGNAKPRSVTADRARARSKALACP